MIFRHFVRPVLKCHASRKACHTETPTDLGALFFQKDVQKILTTLTRMDLDKTFRVRMDGHRNTTPFYTFMTDEQLENARKRAKTKAYHNLQMPPVVNERKEIDKVISVDLALQGFSESKYVFTDIAFGVKNKDRLMVVREPNGVLRSAKWDERHRLNEIYFPSPGREINTPKMFEGEDLKRLLQQGEYEFILDRACIQFEPDEPLYHKITEQVYEMVNNSGHYERLRSTRHFGPLVFYLTRNKQIDDLLLENISTGHINDAVLLIKLYHKLNPTAKSLIEEFPGGNDFKFIEHFVKLDSVMKMKILRAIETMKEMRAMNDSEGSKKLPDQL